MLHPGKAAALDVNAQRRWNAPGHQFSGSSWNDPEVRRDPSLELDYIVAPPRMAHYIDWSTRIYTRHELTTTMQHLHNCLAADMSPHHSVAIQARVRFLAYHRIKPHVPCLLYTS